MTEQQVTEKITDHLVDFAKELGIHPDLIDGQLLINAVVSFQNTYQGYDDYGNLIGVSD